MVKEKKPECFPDTPKGKDEPLHEEKKYWNLNLSQGQYEAIECLSKSEGMLNRVKLNLKWVPLKRKWNISGVCSYWYRKIQVPIFVINCLWEWQSLCYVVKMFG